MGSDSSTVSLGQNLLPGEKQQDVAKREVKTRSTATEDDPPAMIPRKSGPHQTLAIFQEPGTLNIPTKHMLDSKYTDTSIGETTSPRQHTSSRPPSSLVSDEDTDKFIDDDDQCSKAVDNYQRPSTLSHSESSDYSSNSNLEGSGSSETDELCDRLNGSHISEERLAAPILDPARQAVADRIMEHFWVIFDQQWGTDAQQLPANPDQQNQPAVSFSQNPHTANQDTSGRKRTRDGDTSDQEGNDDEHRRFKRRNPRGETTFADALRFACLFRKHNPSRYSIYNHRSCAQSAYPSISRLK